MADAILSIALPYGHVALVDVADAPKLALRPWKYASTGGKSYVISTGCGQVYMHRLIMDAQPGQIVDHINGNTLDNRRCNLRFVDRRGNARNSGSRQTNGRTSKFKGVSWDKKSRGWLASIHADKVTYKIGMFADEIEAACKYDDASHALHGEHGRRNFPNRTPQPIELRKPEKRPEGYGWRQAALRGEIKA